MLSYSVYVLIICLNFLLMNYSVVGCPPAEKIAPHCTCRSFSNDHMMFCKKLFSPDELIGPIKEIAMSKIRLLSLSIDNSSLQYVPDGIFKGVSLEKIRFLSTEILSLSDSDVAFSGLENTLTEIRATDAHYTAHWDWDQLRNLQRMKLIDVNWISMGSIDHPFPKLNELSHLGIIKADISFIVDEAFKELPNLKVLSMKNNYISELKRNMFPNPAKKLLILDFSHNELSNLPDDFFSNMPSLSDVQLDNNKFVTLTENPFSTAFNKLQELTMAGNPFRCDCRLRWLPGTYTPRIFLAKCSSPESLKGVSLNSLDVKSLWC